MYPAVLANIPGLAPVLGDWRLVAYGAVFGFGTALQRTFGGEYGFFNIGALLRRKD